MPNLPVIQISKFFLTAGFWDFMTLTLDQNFTRTAYFAEEFPSDSAFMGRSVYYGYQFWADMQILRFPTRAGTYPLAPTGAYNPSRRLPCSISWLACTSATMYYDTFFALSGIQNTKFAQFFVLQNELTYASLFKTPGLPTSHQAYNALTFLHEQSWAAGNIWWLPNLTYPEHFYPVDHLLGHSASVWPQARLSILRHVMSPVYTHIADTRFSIGRIWISPIHRLAFHLDGMNASQYYAYCQAIVGHPISEFYIRASGVFEPAQYVQWRADVGDTAGTSKQWQAETFNQIRLRRGIVNVRSLVNGRLPVEFIDELAPSFLQRVFYRVLHTLLSSLLSAFFNSLL